MNASPDPTLPPDEDGYALWLRHAPLPEAQARALRRSLRSLCLPGGRPGPTLRLALAELQRGVAGMLGDLEAAGRRGRRSAAGNRGSLALSGTPQLGCLLLITPARWARLGPLRRQLGAAGEDIDAQLRTLCDEGYLIRSLGRGRQRMSLLAAGSERGLLYGAFAWLRLLQTGADPGALDHCSRPAYPLRLLNHWDNLDRSVERGYAGQSIWDWWKLPHILDARYTDYARACASLGINGVSLNNVNARPEMLSAEWIAKAAALAGVFRPWGLRVYLAVRFSSPRELGGLPSADPLDAAVQAWWRDKVAEVFRAIPDFGGFVVKANSEGQPGPQDYGRSHAEGANAIAQALAPHGGVLFWRAFVYASDNPKDRACQAYDEFVPLDGRFLPNVALQVKNGPIDYQPREPFHPLFGAMQATPLVAELMVTKEYMGFSTHLAYQGTLYEELLKSDTQRPQPGTPVARTLAPRDAAGSGPARPQRPHGTAGVANVGSDRNWCGSHFEQANWYAYGRLAWDPTASARDVAEEWTRQTFTQEPSAVRRIVGMLMRSREAVVDYMTPLGLHHLMDTGHHHGPGPWVNELKRPEWNPTYYHRADARGIGFDRSARGSGAVLQYAPGLAQRWGDPASTPEALLLWFHHLPWEHRMRSGRSLWAELVAHYDRGVHAVEQMQRSWARLRRTIDARRHADVAMHLAQQLREARWWRDACLAYFSAVSGRALPKGTRAPEKSLEAYRQVVWLHAPGRG